MGDMAPNLDKDRAGYAAIVVGFNAAQMNAQRGNDPKLAASLFTNSTSGDPRSYGIEINDFVFHFVTATATGGVHMGRNIRHAQARPSKPKVQSSLTGLQSIPTGGAGLTGIKEMMDDTSMTTEMMLLSLQAHIHVQGVSVLDVNNEYQNRTKEADLTVQIAGIVSMHSHENMWAGGLVKAVVPNSLEYSTLSGDWRGIGRATGKVSLVPAMVTPRDVTDYSQIIMHNYIYNNAANALRAMRNTSAHSLVANYAEAQKEFAVTCGIMFQYCLAQRGVHAPAGRTLNPATALEGRTIGAFTPPDAQLAFGPGYQGNHARIFYDKNVPEADGYGRIPVIRLPEEVAIFHGRMTGLLADRDSGSEIVGFVNATVAYERGINHANRVALSNEYADDRAAYDECMNRFYRIMFSQNGEVAKARGRAVIRRTEEFGTPLFTAAPHIARVNALAGGVVGVENPSDNLYGAMLRQQHHAFAYSVAATEDLYNFNRKQIVGYVTQGAKKGTKFHFYYAM